MACGTKYLYKEMMSNWSRKKLQCDGAGEVQSMMLVSADSVQTEGRRWQEDEDSDGGKRLWEKGWCWRRRPLSVENVVA